MLLWVQGAWHTHGTQTWMQTKHLNPQDKNKAGVGVRAFNPSTREGRGRQEDLCEFESSMVYIASYKTARNIQMPYLKQTNKRTNSPQKKLKKKKNRN